MKKLTNRIITSIFFVHFILLAHNLICQGVGVNITGDDPDVSAILDVKSNSQGFLPPRLTTLQRNAILSAAEFLMIFNTDSKCLEIFTNGRWANFWCPCGQPFTDIRDGNVYNTVKIGNQCWMAENLKYLPSIQGGYYVYGFLGSNVSDAKATANYNTYGVLYNATTLLAGESPCNGIGEPPYDKCAQPIQGVCPDGWHIPSHFEWTTLCRSICTSASCDTDFPYNYSETPSGTNEANKLKKNPGWSPAGNNSSGFSALPGGFCSNYNPFTGLGELGRWWSSTGQPNVPLFTRSIYTDFSKIRKDKNNLSNSVRCVR